MESELDRKEMNFLTLKTILIDCDRSLFKNFLILPLTIFDKDFMKSGRHSYIELQNILISNPLKTTVHFSLKKYPSSIFSLFQKIVLFDSHNLPPRISFFMFCNEFCRR